MRKRWSGRRAAVPMIAGVSAVLILGGCSADGTEDVAPPPVPVTSASSEAAPTPVATATPVPSPSSAAPAPTAAAPAAPKPTAPAQTAPAPPPELTQAPRVAPEQADAAGGFTACAQRYQERAQSITLGGAITPLLLEQWGQAYQDASALAAEGDPVAAEEACLALQREMDNVLG